MKTHCMITHYQSQLATKAAKAAVLKWARGGILGPDFWQSLIEELFRKLRTIKSVRYWELIESWTLYLDVSGNSALNKNPKTLIFAWRYKP